MKKIFVGILFSGISFFVYANDSAAVSDGSGAYINLNFGLANQSYTPTGMFATSANAGYSFNRALAVEAGYTNLAGSEFGATQTNNIFDVAVKGTIPFNNIFALYGRLGGGLNYFSWGGVANAGTPVWYANQRSSVNFVGLASIGGSFALSRHFDLRLEDTMYIPMGGGNPTTGQSNLVLGGVQYNF